LRGTPRRPLGHPRPGPGLRQDLTGTNFLANDRLLNDRLLNNRLGYDWLAYDRCADVFGCLRISLSHHRTSSPIRVVLAIS
jgi:hypothetical protein